MVTESVHCQECRACCHSRSIHEQASGEIDVVVATCDTLTEQGNEGNNVKFILRHGVSSVSLPLLLVAVVMAVSV